MGLPSAPAPPPPLTPPAQVGTLPAGRCLVWCAGCRRIMTVLHDWTEFICPKCKLQQMLPTELMRPPLHPPPPPEEANKMGSRLDEVVDISDSEINKYKEDTYELLKFRACKIRAHDGKFKCPFCSGKGIQYHQYDHLLQHAAQVAEGSAQSAKQRANHFALAKYLLTEPPDDVNPPPQSMRPSTAPKCGDNPTRVKIIKKFQKSSEACGGSRKERIDQRTSPGLSIYDRFAHDDANKSERPEGDNLHKKEALKRISDNYMKLLKTETRKLRHMARNDIKGVLKEEEGLLNLKFEREKRKLDSWSKELDKRVALIEHERQKLELDKTEKDLRINQMAENLRETEEKCRGLDKRLKEKEFELSNLEVVHQHSVLKERQGNDELQEVRLELIKKDLRINQMAEKLREAEEICRGLDKKLKEKEVALSDVEVVHQHSVLKERQCNDELQEVHLELIQKDLRINQMAEKLREAEEICRGLDKRLKEKEVALSDVKVEHQHSVLKEWQCNDELQEVRLELIRKDLRINQMAEKLREVEQICRGLDKRLKEKEVASSDEEVVHQHSVLKERQGNDELQEVRLELIKLFSEMPSCSRVDFGVKKMGEIDEKAIKDACKKRFPPFEAEIKALELRIFWKKELNENPHWQPFLIIEDDEGNPKGLLKRDDKQLQCLKDNWGEEIHNIVYAALIDLHEYRSGNYMDAEFWNFKENRKATLTEIISYISTYLKTLNEESNVRKRLRRSRVVIKEELQHF